MRSLTNSAAAYVYRIPTTTQTPAAVFIAALDTAGTILAGYNISIGEVTYTFANPVVNAYDVLFHPGQNLANLLAAITGDNGAYTNRGTLYGKGTVANPAVATLNEVPGYNNSIGTASINGSLYKYLNLISPDFGAQYNSTPVATNQPAVLYLLPNLSALSPLTSTFVGGTNSVLNNSITAPSTWLEFDDLYTNVVKSQVVDDKFQRYYWASPSVPPQYNTLARIQAGNTGPNAPWALGINPPGCAPGVSVAGGGASAQLGFTTSNGATKYIGGNKVFLFPIVPAGAMQISDVTFVPTLTNANVEYAAVLYADTGQGGNTPTAPGALLNTGIIATGIAVGTNAISAFTNPTSLNINVPYWVGIIISQTIQVAQGDGLASSVSFVNTFANGPATTAPATSPDLDVQMWADLLTTDVIEARSYVYTWVSAYGEESAPSPPTLVDGWANGVWTIGLFLPPADDIGINRNLAIIRLYRTVVATGGSTVYYWVADISMGSSNTDAQAAVAADTVNGVPCSPPSSTYVDTQLDTVVALNIILPSTNYFPPPENLQGILALPNGLYAAWKNNEIWFAQPYYPHAWPPGYVITTEYPIVGLGYTNGAIVACTSANPWVITGTNPAQMSSLKCYPAQPCTSRGSIVSNDIGVFYISPNGLIQVVNTGACTNVTELWVTMEKWAQLVPLKNTFAVPLASCYFCFGTVQNGDTSVAQQGFNIEMDQDNTSFSIWPQPGGHRVGFNKMQAPQGFNINNLIVDPWTSYVMVVQNGQVYWYDFTNPQPVMQPYDWQSKWYQQNTKKSFEAMRMWFTVPPGTPTPTGPRNTAPPSDPSWNALGPNQYAIVKVWGDIANPSNPGSLSLLTCREVRKSGEVLRIESGFKCETWMWEILGQVVVSNLQVGTSVKELANV